MKEEHIKLIESVKLKIQELTKQQDELYDKLLEDISFNKSTVDSDTWLFDYVFNDFGEIPSEYSEMVKHKVYNE